MAVICALLGIIFLVRGAIFCFSENAVEEARVYTIRGGLVLAALSAFFFYIGV